MAGVSRYQYPPNIRIIRVLCSGRIKPAHILKAIELGADGVLVAGCHPADCHYISGNKHAEKRVEMTKKLINMLGIDAKRLRLEWISASEGARFAETIREFVKDLQELGPIQHAPPYSKKNTPASSLMTKIIDETKAYYCIECGKCTSTCPVSRVYEGYSPRLNVERALLGFDDELKKSKDLWSCLTCNLCSDKCPDGVKYTEFIKNVRIEAHKIGEKGRCTHGGALLTLMSLMANIESSQNRLGWVSNDLRTSKKGDILYFTGCLPYFEVFFEEIETHAINIAKNVVGILNKAGIKPVVMDDERCCGHDLLWTGDLENFEKLSRANLNAINRTGVKRVVVSCPECYRTLRKDYPEFLGKLDFEVVHISEFIDKLIQDGKIKFNGELKEKVTYHDSCRLGRHMGIFDEPRRVINSIPGIELEEMRKNRSDSMCCGTSAWTNCESYSKQMQIDLLKEARATDANLLVTSCPKCQIHLKCTLHDKTLVERDRAQIKINDLTVLIARALGVGGDF